MAQLFLQYKAYLDKDNRYIEQETPETKHELYLGANVTIDDVTQYIVTGKRGHPMFEIIEQHHVVKVCSLACLSTALLILIIVPRMFFILRIVPSAERALCKTNRV